MTGKDDEVTNDPRLFDDGAPLVSKKDGALFYESKTVEWWTPRKYIDLAAEVMGGIDLDPASCAGANEIVKAHKFYSADGELQSWSGRVWLNPPYGKQTKKFVARLLYEHKLGHVEQAVVLLNVITLDRSWFRPLWHFPVCFHYGRVKFTSPDVVSGKIRSVSSPPTGSVFIYLGPNTERFASVFGEIGAVMTCVS